MIPEVVAGNHSVTPEGWLKSTDFVHARYFSSNLGRFLSVDPVGGEVGSSQSWNRYSYVRNNPVNLVDPTGRKDKEFDPTKDGPVNEDQSTRTPIIIENKKGRSRVNPDAYNCHSYAWHDSQGDPTDPGNADLVSAGVTKWDNSPEDDLGSATQLSPDAPNEPGDRVIYFFDADASGSYERGEPIDHSAIVTNVDSEGYTTEVTGKMGQLGISTNHPRAPGYYDVYRDPKSRHVVGPTSRAYYRPNSGG